MGRAIIMHIDDAPWIRGGPRGEGDHPDGGGSDADPARTEPYVDRDDELQVAACVLDAFARG